MSEAATRPAEEDSTEAEPSPNDDRTARIEVLREENQRLREEYARARRTQYRRTALALAAVGLVAALGGALFPNSRTVLFALGGTGLFAAALTYYLTPEQFVSATVGEGVYSAFATTEAALVDELGLQDDRVYLPGPETVEGSSVRLFVPQNADYRLPEPMALGSVFVVDDEAARGVSLHPSGGPLFEEFRRALSTELPGDADRLADRLTDGLVEEFELVRSTTRDVSGTPDGEGSVTIGIDGSAYGAVDRIDHPVASFLGVGFAEGLDRAVSVTARSVDDDRADYLVTCSWDD
ncbi:hypothetical protein [Halococcus hamelinensis]|uniref:DUF7982 domain-containing protein n=1 Tax=Halococcus hamelinensis 100A6 TaxID=1132509 RepID=M0LXL0_9EURY|nr:hypothetical protein [Halococcus hamelinensis]EMA37908.1 hypothetical protein C447_10745 [Halococcus hamelinensis 100A6]